MPDIRSAATTDTFFRAADENPALPPWRSATSFNGRMRIDVPGGGGNGTLRPFGPGDMLDYYDGLGTFSGSFEIWGLCADVPDLTESYRIGFFEAAGIGGASVNGYQLLQVHGIGGSNWVLRRYDGGGFTIIGQVNPFTSANDGTCILLKFSDTDIEVWANFAPPYDDTWSLVMTVSDSTYRSEMYPMLGISSDDGSGPAWHEFGVAVLNWLPSFIRRQTG